MACSTTSHYTGIKAISGFYVQNTAYYQKKSKSVFFKNLTGYDSRICPENEEYWKKMPLKFYPIVTLRMKNPKKINWDTISFNGFLNQLEIDKSAKVGALVSLNDSLCGKSFINRYDHINLGELVSEICCPEAAKDNLCIVPSEKAEFKVIRELNPDVLFQIKNTYFNFGMIKNGQVYFTKFHNGEPGLRTQSEYIQNYETKYKQSWQISVIKKKFKMKK